MFRSILVPLDGSSFSEHALPLALTIARRAGSHIQVVHVHAPGDPKFPDWYLPTGQRSDPEAVGLQRSYLDQVVSKLEAGGVRASSAVLAGQTVYALLEHATRSGADLVAMTTHGRGLLSRAWLGSVADSLLRQLTVPLLLVRPSQGPADLNTDVRMSSVLVPLDGSAHAEAILEPALHLASVMGASCTLLEVVAPVPVVGYDVFGYAPAGTDTTLVEELRRKGVDYLDGVARRLKARNIEPGRHVVIQPSAAGAILQEAETRGHDLIALETHGRGGASRMLLGSVADKVVRGTTVPVLVHRSPER
jgi:nucleotide-binding universal stress UspA family protein